MSTTSPSGLVLVRFGALGDLILATSAATRVKRHRPDLRVAVVTRHALAPVLYRHPDIDRVVVPPPGHSGPAGLQALARTLRADGWEDVVDLHGNLRSRLLTAFLRPRRVVRYRGRGLERRLLVVAPGIARRFRPVPRGYRVIDAYAGAVDRWFTASGVEPPGSAAPDPSVHVAPAEVHWAFGEMERLGIPHGAFGLAPGARHATKRWPIGYYAELIDRLAVRRDTVVPVFLGGSTADLELETALRGAVRRPEALRIVRQPIRRVAALLGRLTGLVTNDSGLMHLAAAVCTPVVALFGPTVGEFGFLPAGTGHQVLERPLDCRPCSVHGGESCPRGHFRCLKEIAPEEVLAALTRLERREGRTESRDRSDDTR
jgi:ADP-heptose:LPS heptosyltransferase